MTVGALFCSDHTLPPSNLFRASHASEKRVSGVVYRRTGLDDGPRYLIDSHASDVGAKRHVQSW